MAKSKSQIGAQVTFHPVDNTTKPKGQDVPAIIVSEYEQHVPAEQTAGNEDFKRPVVNLVVFVDTETGTVRKQRVPHKDDALKGEAYYF